MSYSLRIFLSSLDILDHFSHHLDSIVLGKEMVQSTNTSSMSRRAHLFSFFYWYYLEHKLIHSDFLATKCCLYQFFVSDLLIYFAPNTLDGGGLYESVCILTGLWKWLVKQELY